MARLSMAVTLVLLLPLVGCRDEQPTQITNPPPAAATTTDELKDEIEDLIDELYAESAKKEDAQELWEDLREALESDQASTAVDLMFDLLDLTYSTELSDPKGDLTTNEGVAELTTALFEFVGLDAPSLSNEELANALGEDGDDGTLQVAFDGETNEIVTDSGFAGTIIEGEDIDQDVLIAIDRLTLAEQEELPEGDCLPDSELEQAEGCYQFDRIPENIFQDTVEVGVCPDQDLDDEGFQLHEFEDAGDGGVEGIVALPSIAFTAAGFDCTDFTIVRSGETPFPWRLARAAWSATGGKLLSWIGPAPLRAIDSGDGGSTLDFSRIGWAKQMDVDIVEGDGQSEPAGSTLPTDPGVQVTHLPETDDNNPVGGVDVTFTVVEGGGTISSGQSSGSTLVVATDGNGNASVEWTLGSSTGTQRLRATVPNDTVVFTATATDLTILFSSDRDGEELWTMNPDGSGLQQLTDNSVRDFAPVWSPDGSKVAFMSDRDTDGGIDIYTLDLSTSTVTRLTSDPGFDSAPDWSPDGTRIAFHSDRDGDAEIYTMDADDGQNLVQLTANDSTDVSPRWSPDGTRIAFHSDRDVDREIFTMDADDGSNVVKLTDNSDLDAGPAWSPDGSRIAFSSDRDGDREIWIMDSDGTNPVQVTTNTGDFDINATWSPDGTMIAFEKDDGSQRDIWRIEVDGSNPVNLTDDPSNDQFPDWRRP